MGQEVLTWWGVGLNSPSGLGAEAFWPKGPRTQIMGL